MFTIAIYAVLILILSRDLRGPDRDCTRSVCIHDAYEFCRGKHHSPEQRAKSALRQRIFCFWIAKSIPETFAESQASVASIIPPPGEAQPFVARADKEQKAREVEQTWQIIIEADLKAALIRRCKVHT